MKNESIALTHALSKACAPALTAALAGIICAALAPAARAADGVAALSSLESVKVDSDDRRVTFKNRLDQGEQFLLKATGSIAFGDEAMDAEYGGFGPGKSGKDLAGGADVGIDVGLRAPRPMPGAAPTRRKWFGSYRNDHTYYMVVDGYGGPLTLKLVPPSAQTGAGSIAVSLYRLSTLPSPLANPLETLRVPVLQNTYPTVMTTKKSVIYLLQTSGEGKVGGGGVGRGDADYMDYRADGYGQVDIGDANTDYGLGVDEADLSKSPRARWWGPWRKDHTYDMLFEGTGQPIHFFFYDVNGGYGDNSPTDALTVKVFALP